VSTARNRLRSQRIEGPPLNRAVDVVRWLVASQAQDYAGAKWALGLRMREATDATVEKEFTDGAILRTHVIRPTWHFVAREDIRWLLTFTAPRVHAALAYRYRQLELDARTLRKANAALRRAFDGGRYLTREELRQVLGRARIGTLDGQRTAQILAHAELEALICSGPRRGKQFTYTLLDERAPDARTLSREDALVELSARYFASRGPATVHDFAKWSSLTVAEARSGVEAIRSKLRRELMDGRTYWSSRSARPARRGPPRAHLLSIYDEYISSYRDRGAICEPAHARRLVAMGNALAYVVVLDGRIAGTWSRTFEKQTVHVRVSPFRRLTRVERGAVVAAAERFTSFMGLEHRLDLMVASRHGVPV
jgi:DNA glycosylase AlkZ-like